jgi:hypothetical protein
MQLGTKIVSITLGSIFLTAAAGLLIQRSVIHKQGVEMTRDAMRATILGAENTRQSVSSMRTNGVFDDAKLKAELATNTDYRQSKIYTTVPVVAAWNSIADVAAKEGYEFRVPAHNPRNPKNVPQGDEERILSLLETQHLPEYFAVDEQAGEMVFARPIALTSDCLACHGDPSRSPSGNGKDLLGFRMEGWKEGDLHGMFLLKTKMERVNRIVWSGLVEVLAWLVPLALLVGLVAYWVISRISRRLKTLTDSVSTGSKEVTSAAAQISASSQSLAHGASSQAGSLEETSVAAEEITSMARKNTDNTQLAATEMEAVSTRVRESDASIAAMIASMEEMNESSQKISKIIQVIDEISFQTNLLALNAAVEAARAGDAGQGFAVVADEVRSLASRSADAAKDTASLIEDLLAKSNAGSATLERVVTVFRGISDSAAKVKTLIDDVSLGSQEQTRGIEQVLRSIQQMDKIIQASAANAQEGAATAQQLSAQAAAMDGIAQQLHAVVEG